MTKYIIKVQRGGLYWLYEKNKNNKIINIYINYKEIEKVLIVYSWVHFQKAYQIKVCRDICE